LKEIFLIWMFTLIIIPQCFGFDLSKSEGIDYSVKYLGVLVVRVSIKSEPLVDNPDSGYYRIDIRAKTTKFWGMFYSVDNNYITYLDSLGHPLIYRRFINEKSFKNNSVQRFDNRFNRIYYDGDTAIDHPGDLENLFSGIYGLRLKNLAAGDEDSFCINAEKAAWKVLWAVEDTEKVKIGNKAIPCIRVQVHFIPFVPEAKRLRSDILTNKLVNENTKLTIFFSADKRHLPVKINYKFSPFDVKAVIENFPDD